MTNVIALLHVSNVLLKNIPLKGSRWQQVSFFTLVEKVHFFLVSLENMNFVTSLFHHCVASVFYLTCPCAMGARFSSCLLLQGGGLHYSSSSHFPVIF